jgi:acetyl-CoA C-acetyltransferase
MAFQPVYVVDGARTPFLKARNGPGPFSASDLAVQAGRALLLRQPFRPEDLDEVILGCASPSPDEVNIGRVVALRMGCGNKVPGWTVMRNCASGMQAIDSALANIQSGRANLVLAGGTDALSHAPLFYNKTMVQWFAEMMQAKSLGEKIAAFARLKPAAALSPVIGILKGLTDPMVGLSMGQTAENLAWQFGISRLQMDEYAEQSHLRVVQGRAVGRYGEIVPLVDVQGKVYGEDDGVRPDSTVSGLAKLKPFFDKKYGRITPGNSSQITDGAAWLILASEAAVEKWQLQPLGKIMDSQWAGLDPAQMGLGPVQGCLAAWASDDYCRDELALPSALGILPMDKLNVDGGAIALGHPVGASGARIVLHLLHVLRARQVKRGMAAICIGGGLGGAMLVEALEPVNAP